MSQVTLADSAEPLTERQLRPLTREPHWSEQRAALHGLARGITGVPYYGGELESSSSNVLD